MTTLNKVNIKGVEYEISDIKCMEIEVESEERYFSISLGNNIIDFNYPIAIEFMDLLVQYDGAKNEWYMDGDYWSEWDSYVSVYVLNCISTKLGFSNIDSFIDFDFYKLTNYPTKIKFKIYYHPTTIITSLYWAEL